MKVLVTSKRFAGYAPRLPDLAPPTNSERSARRCAASACYGRRIGPQSPVLAGTASAMARAASDGLSGLRDRALLLLDFAGAFRRLELAALAWPIHPGFLRLAEVYAAGLFLYDG
jgi:hypothetical protein